MTPQNGNQAGPAGREPCGRRVVITKATRDFGRTPALFSARRGVLLFARNPVVAEHVADEIRGPESGTVSRCTRSTSATQTHWIRTGTRPPRRAGDKLTAHLLVKRVMFAIDQPQDRCIKSFHFERTI